MSNATTIFAGINQRIIEDLRKELIAQGHHLSGSLEESLVGFIITNGVTVFLQSTAKYYIEYVNNGFPAKSASFKQFPFVVKYFQYRGLSEKEAKSAAAATIKKWQKEGMPTESSKSFSNTGLRKETVQQVFARNDGEYAKLIDQAAVSSFDSELKTIKSGTL